MFVKLRYDFPISDFDVIKAGTELELLPEWNEYSGFIAVKYREGSLYMNNLYFDPVPILVSL
ncbi:hypothetical protein V7128_01835 [Neobacillus vireti]|uniref:hypothetical protein n=1 Tax=Neobacillus vireti TaxID=220686 RepID=UPI002FFE80B6